MNEQLIAEINAVRFSPVRTKAGYDVSQVDTFLDQLAAAVGEGRPVHDLIEIAVFTTTHLREGYRMGEVDAFLDHVDAAAGATGGVADVIAPVATAFPSTPAPALPTDVVQEQKGLFSRLFGR